MPTYRIDWPDRSETIEADSVRIEGIHQVLRGTALVIGQPREVVVRRVPRHVLVEQLDGLISGPPWPSEVAAPACRSGERGERGEPLHPR